MERIRKNPRVPERIRKNTKESKKILKNQFYVVVFTVGKWIKEKEGWKRMVACARKVFYERNLKDKSKMHFS